MKTLSSFLLVLVGCLSAEGQVKITGIHRDGLVSWTNRCCTTQPVYELLSATSVTGTWQQVVLVTNQTFTAIHLPESAGAGFYRVGWCADELLEFRYSFSNLVYYGGRPWWCNSVTGMVSLALWKGTLAWHFAPTERCDRTGGHVLGTGEWAIMYLTTNGEFQAGTRMQYLQGWLESSNTTQGCIYKRSYGAVMQEGFAEDTAIGSFVAERLPVPGAVLLRK